MPGTVDIQCAVSEPRAKTAISWKKIAFGFTLVISLTATLTRYMFLPLHTKPCCPKCPVYKNADPSNPHSVRFRSCLMNSKEKASIPLRNAFTHENSTRFLCVRFMGRVGNQMFQFASLIGISRSKGMIPVIRKSNILYNLFTMDGVNSVSYKVCKRVKVHKDKRSCAFDEQSVNFTNKKNLGLFGYFQSWRYFFNSSVELRRLFTIKPLQIQAAQKALRRFTEEQHGNISLKERVIVGVHIRRGDISSSGANKNHGYVVASKHYLQQAMGFYRKQFQKVLFVICSDSNMWPFLNLPHNDSVFINGQKAEADMAILSICNHSIITVGSFGWWTGWLAGGTVVYPKHQFSKGSYLETQFNLSDYFPPGWIGM